MCRDYMLLTMKTRNLTASGRKLDVKMGANCLCKGGGKRVPEEIPPPKKRSLGITSGSKATIHKELGGGTAMVLLKNSGMSP